jgi:hypothetical protein
VGRRQRCGAKQAIVPCPVRGDPVSETLARKINVVYHRELGSFSLSHHTRFSLSVLRRDDVIEIPWNHHMWLAT